MFLLPFLCHWIFVAVWHMHAKCSAKSVSSYRWNYVIRLMQANTERSVLKWNDLDCAKLYIFLIKTFVMVVFCFLSSLYVSLFFFFSLSLFWWWLYAFVWPVLFSLPYKPGFAFYLLGKSISVPCFFFLCLCLCGTWPANIT